MVSQAVEHDDEVIDIPWMESHGRLVKDIDETDEVTVELPGTRWLSPPDQRRHPADERQVADSDIDEVAERPGGRSVRTTSRIGS